METVIVKLRIVLRKRGGGKNKEKGLECSRSIFLAEKRK